MNRRIIILIGLGIFLCLAFIFVFFRLGASNVVQTPPPAPIPETTSTTPTAQTPPPPITFKDGSKLYTLSQVQGGGYSFYAGQLNDSDQRLGADEESQILKILETAHFPPKLMNNTVLFSLSPDSSSPSKVFLKAGGNEISVDLNNAEISTRDGAYIKVSQGARAILLNNRILPGSKAFTLLMLHELGHRLGDELSPADWQTFYGLRLMPKGAPIVSSTWDLSPNEDFAEVYKYITAKNDFSIDDKASAVRTRFGFLLPKDPSLEKTCATLTVQGDTSLRLQECRRYVSLNHDSYPDETEYYDGNETKLKDFIASKINSL